MKYDSRSQIITKLKMKATNNCPVRHNVVSIPLYLENIFSSVTFVLPVILAACACKTLLLLLPCAQIYACTEDKFSWKHDGSGNGLLARSSRLPLQNYFIGGLRGWETSLAVNFYKKELDYKATIGIESGTRSIQLDNKIVKAQVRELSEKQDHMDYIELSPLSDHFSEN